MSHLTETPADTIWRVVRPVLKILLVLGVLAAILGVWLVWQIGQAFPETHPVRAPVAWVTRDVELSAEEPVIRGRLVLTATSTPSHDLRIGVNAGAPKGVAAASPGAILAGPTVHVSTDDAQGLDSCVAPCELQMVPTWDCDKTLCRMAAGFSLELPVDAAGTAGVVTIWIAGGATGSLDDELPNDFEATLELGGGDAGPGAS